MDPAATLNIIVTATTAQANAALAKTQAQLKATAATAQASGAKTQAATSRAGAAMASFAKVGIAAGVTFAAASTKMAYDFEESMTKIRTLVGASEKQVHEWSDALLDMAGQVGKSPQELADALYYVSSSGIEANKVLSTTKTAAKAASLGLGDTQVIADALTSSMNAYAKSGLSAAEATDVLIKTVKLGKIEPDELAMSIGRVIPIASKLSVGFDDVGAALAAMSLQGLDAAESTTALRGIFTAVIKPQEQSEEALKKVGLSAEYLRKVLDEKGTLAMLQLLSKRFHGNIEAMGKVFPNVRALVGAFNLTGENAKRNAEIFKELGADTNDLGKAWKEFSSTPAAKMQKAWASLQAVMVRLGSRLLPVAADAFKGLADAVGEFDKEMRGENGEGSGAAAANLTKLLGGLLDVANDTAGSYEKMLDVFSDHPDVSGWDEFAAKLEDLDTGLKDFVRTNLGGFSPFGIFDTDQVDEDADHVETRIERMINAVNDDTRVGMYQQLREWQTAGKKINEQMIWDWAERGKITASGAAELISTLHRLQANTRRAFDKLSDAAKDSGRDVKDFSVASADWLDQFAGSGKEDLKTLGNYLEGPLEKALEGAGRDVKDFTKEANDAVDKMAKNGWKGFRSFSQSAKAAVDATGEALTTLKLNINNALKGMQVKKTVSYEIQKVGATAKGFQAGGVIVPGQGDGDKVPAMLEPGEVVLNKKAVAAMGGSGRANRINRRVPRFASGGVIEQALGPYSIPPITYDPNHAGGNSHLHLDFFTKSQAIAYGKKMQGMGWSIAEYSGPYGGFGGITTHHESPGHYDGTAFDANTSADETKSEVAAVARLLNGGKLAGAMVEKLANLILKGPATVYRDLGQKGIDMALSAGNAYLAKYAPTDGYTSVGGGGPVVAQMGRILLGNGFTRAGAAGIIGNAYRESLWNPGATGTGGGGLFGFTTSPISLADLQNFAQRKGTPWTNVATQMEFMLANPGGGGLITESYYNGLESFLKSTKNVHDATYRFMDEWERPGIPAFEDRLAGAQKAFQDNSWQRGGIVQKLKGGGKVLPPGYDPDTYLPASLGDSLWLQAGKKGRRAALLMKEAKKLGKRLNKLTGVRGGIAKIDEMLQIAETKAGMEDSPMGTELSEGETAKQKQLLRRLLGRLRDANKWAKAGSGIAGQGVKMGDKKTAPRFRELRQTFQDVILEMEGATGKGGRIFDTKMALRDLKPGPAPPPTAYSISDLRSIIEAARYGVFDNQLPRFHSGGVYRAPAGRNEGPAMLKDGERVSSANETFVGYATVQIGGDTVAERVRMEFKQRDRETHLAGRQYRP